MKKHNYLNNKDILKEIHKSKITYCSFIEPYMSTYDVIIPFNGMTAHDSINAAINAPTINDEMSIVELASANRQTRLAKEAQETDLLAGTKRKLDDYLIPLGEISVSDLIFRVMSWDHIPIDELKQQKSDAKAQEEYESAFEDDEDEMLDNIKGPAKYVKVNFPPFYHFKVTEDLKPFCVGKSHWKGDLVTGEFSKSHGQMTNTLATMFMKLCERYATRSNWRGYTYNDEMRSQALLQLSQIGLQFDESKSQNPFAYYTAAITNSFTRVLNIEKRNQAIRDDILEMNNFNPSYTRQNEWAINKWGSDE